MSNGLLKEYPGDVFCTESLTPAAFFLTVQRFVWSRATNDGAVRRPRNGLTMEAYAVVETGGKQYRVSTGDTLSVEKLDAEAGDKIELSSVLAVSDGKKLTIGTPTVEDAKVTSTVVEQTRGPKVISFKKKRRKGYSRKKGHRQSLTVLKVESIQ